MCVCVCVRACVRGVRACVRACVRVCARGAPPPPPGSPPLFGKQILISVFWGVGLQTPGYSWSDRMGDATGPKKCIGILRVNARIYYLI